jgi:hypothetical protein
MELPSISVRKWMYALLAAGLGSELSAQPAQTAVSGIVSYVFEPNPQEIKPKMYNWEIKLNQADSKAGVYEIIQITRPAKAHVTAANAVSDVLIPSKVILPGRVGAVNVNLVNFNLYVGDKAPHQNMGRRGNSGQPIILSGIGTGNGASSWVVFPGAKIERVLPSVSGTRLSHGKLRLIQFIVSNDRGEQFQTDVILRRK